MRATDKRNQSEDVTSDLACTRCRERKIRCGRERPECSNCERDAGITCIYQIPARRVNHLKLLCDSVDQLQDRLTTIESQLGRLSSTIVPAVDFEDASSAGQPSTGRRSSDDDEDGEDDEERDSHLENNSFLTDDLTHLHIFRSPVDMVDRYHGLSSPFTLCNNLRTRISATTNTPESGSLRDLLGSLCEIAGAAEPFPSYNDHPPIQLPPKQQVITAVGRFFQHVDCTTDVFVQSNLLANVQRVYSQPPEPGDDVWAACLNAITILVLGVEISTQAGNALFGDFARSLLPNRAALVSSRLLTTPRLINVQTLILLSTAAQKFDPAGWAELLFTHACTLARTMGFHHAELLPSSASADEIVERAKVLQSLYVRDKSLCTTRGSVSWLPSYDCNITAQLRTVVECQAPYSARIRLAMIQDEVYRFTCAASGYRRNSTLSTKSQSTLQSIEQQLDQFALDFGIFNVLNFSSSPRAALISMEFLATRILALQHVCEPCHAEKLRSDARASCLLLLLAHGDQTRAVIDAYHSLVSTKVPNNRNQAIPTGEVSSASFTNLLDAFSVPAFFILLEGHTHPTKRDSDEQANADLDLLRKVSACYTKTSMQMQSNSFYGKVARIFDKLLTSIDLFSHAQQGPHTAVRPSAAVAELTWLNPPIPTPPPHPDTIDIPAISPLQQGDVSNLSSLPLSVPPSTSVAWDNWLSLPTSIGQPTLAADTQNLMHVSGAGSPPDLLTHVLNVPNCVPDSFNEQIQWRPTALAPYSSRKRSRIAADNPDGS